MEPKITIIPIEINFLVALPFWSVKEIRFSTVITLEDLNYEIYGLLFIILKTNPYTAITFEGECTL